MNFNVLGPLEITSEGRPVPLSLDPPVKCRVRRLSALASTSGSRVCLSCC